MEKGLTVPKWVRIVQPKIPQMSQNLFAQFVCPSSKALDFNEKRLTWASVVRASILLLLSAIKIPLAFVLNAERDSRMKSTFSILK